MSIPAAFNQALASVEELQLASKALAIRVTNFAGNGSADVAAANLPATGAATPINDTGLVATIAYTAATNTHTITIPRAIERNKIFVLYSVDQPVPATPSAAQVTVNVTEQTVTVSGATTVITFRLRDAANADFVINTTGAAVNLQINIITI